MFPLQQLDLHFDENSLPRVKVLNIELYRICEVLQIIFSMCTLFELEIPTDIKYITSSPQFKIGPHQGRSIIIHINFSCCSVWVEDF